MRQNLIFLILFTLSGLLLANNEKKIKFNNSERVDMITQSRDYTNVVLFSMATQTYSINIFKKNGEIALKKENINHRVNFLDTITDLNMIIFSTQKNEMQDDIVSIDINTGAILWNSTSSAKSYELSRNKRYLITNTPNLDSEIKFELINVVNGEKVLSKRFKFAYYATWFSNDKILFGFQEYDKIKNPRYEDYLNNRDEKAKLIHERHILKIRLNKKDITNNEYMDLKKEIDLKISNLEKERKDEFHSTRRSSVLRDKYIFLPAKLSLFNINTMNFGLKRSLLDRTSEPIYFDPMSIGGLLMVDKEGNIFVRGHKNKKDEKYNHYLIKVNSDLEISWEYHINHPFRFSILESNNQFYFGFKHNSTYYFLNKSRIKYSKDQLILNGFVPSNIKLEKIFEKVVNILQPGLDFDNENNTLIFHNSKGE